MSFGERLKSARKDRGMTLRELGEAIDRSESVVQRYESGVIANLDNEIIAKLASALNVNPAYLMGWTEVNPANTVKIPILGDIACGDPITAEDNIVDYQATTLPLHNNQLKKSDSLNSVNLTNDDIMSIEEEIEEVLDVEELNRLNNKFDIFSEKFHDSQIENTEKLTTLTTKMDSVQNELSRLNETQQRLPERIRDELSKLQSEKKDNNKNIWIAPLVTGITSGIVVGIVVAVALYYMGIS